MHKLSFFYFRSKFVPRPALPKYKMFKIINYNISNCMDFNYLSLNHSLPWRMWHSIFIFKSFFFKKNIASKFNYVFLWCNTMHLEHSQQWRQNFSYLATPKVILSILATHMLQQWIYFNFQYNKIIYTSQ